MLVFVDSTLSSSPTSAWVTAHKPGAHCTDSRQLNRLEVVLSREFSWPKSPLQVPWPVSAPARCLVSESSLQPDLSESESQQSLLFGLGGGASKSHQFQGFPEVILSCLLSVFKGFPAGMFQTRRK